MKYRCEATSAEAVVQLIAASYLRHGYYWYVTGHIPERKSPATVDRKLIGKYGIDVTEWQRARRRQQGLANAQYLRFGHWFIFLLTEGHHALRAHASKGGEGEKLQDFRRVPLRFQRVLHFLPAEWRRPHRRWSNEMACSRSDRWGYLCFAQGPLQPARSTPKC
jgi:hypothetical protein